MPNETTANPWGVDGERILVVAHPDDETLWFSAAVSRVDRILICFDPPGVPTERSADILGGIPLPGVECLRLQAFGGYCRHHFAFPITTPAGLLLWRHPGQELKYRRNARRLKEELSARIAAGSTVITHSPWGEYGHEEHVQLHRVLSSLRKPLSLRVWHPNYATNKSLPLLRRSLFRSGFDLATLPTDAELLRKMKEYYARHAVWTWRLDWQGFATESYIRPLVEKEWPTYTHAPPLNLFKLDY